MDRKFKNKVEMDLAVGFYNSGVNHADQGNLVLAIADFTKVIELDPQMIQAYINRASVYKKQKNYVQAIADYNKLLEKNPQDIMALNNLGSAYAQQGNYKKAIAEYDKAIDIKPTDPVAYHNSIVSHYALKEYEWAWEDVHAVEGLGAKVNPELIKMLKSVVGEG